MSILSIRDEVSALVWGDGTATPIVDEWTPREAWIEALTNQRQSELREAAKCDSYYPEGATENRARAARCAELLAELESARETS